jgi:hypothetical protein
MIALSKLNNWKYSESRVKAFGWLKISSAYFVSLPNHGGSGRTVEPTTTRSAGFADRA